MFMSSAVKRSKLACGVAILLLVFASVDTSCFPCCSAGPGGAPVAAAERTDGTAQQWVVATRADDSRQHRHSDEDRCNDDCFCCSSMTAGVIFNNITLPDRKTTLVIVENVLVPFPPLARTFHPPRFA
jgi:hypothetical protein